MSKDSQKTFIQWLKSKGSAPYINYYNALSGLQTGTTAFAAKWAELGNKNETEFYMIQEEYFSRTYFGNAIKDFKSWFDVDLRQQPYGVQEAMYSLYIQHGENNTMMKNIYGTGNKYSQTPPVQVIETLYNERSKTNGSTLVYFKSNSSDVQQGVYNRLRYNEKCDALALLSNPSLNLKTDNTGCAYVYNRPIGG